MTAVLLAVVLFLVGPVVAVLAFWRRHRLMWWASVEPPVCPWCRRRHDAPWPTRGSCGWMTRNDFRRRENFP